MQEIPEKDDILAQSLSLRRRYFPDAKKTTFLPKFQKKTTFLRKDDILAKKTTFLQSNYQIGSDIWRNGKKHSELEFVNLIRSKGPCFRGGNEMADVAHEWSKGFEIQSKQPKLRPELRGNDRSSVGTIEIRMDRMVRKSRRSEANLDPFIRTDPHYAEWFRKGFGRI
ncbi:hypothetical protein GGU10DRAFT_438011 [Lentinula aff. detonsa]|uniref:Uncharacterized protein n=1 Tax=Lentinula aff. detonsa TaxID=2804958 RepID=A0AA38L1K7_9AGAR|nr:hypothetical protein GGU10DRAFT_438011 [Lentinula aff. detonsa]